MLFIFAKVGLYYPFLSNTNFEQYEACHPKYETRTKTTDLFDHHYCIGDRALAFGIKTAIVGGMVDYAVVAFVFDKHGGGAASIKIDSIAATQPTHHFG